MTTYRESESKILEIDFRDMTQKIEFIWWRLEFYKKEFTAIWMRNMLWEKFRLRQEGDDVVCEHKEIQKAEEWVKHADETPIRLSSSLEQWVTFFNKIWFKQISKSVKLRTSYLLDLSESWNWEANIVIDEYSDLAWLKIPPLIEIEAINRNVIVEIAKLLWFSGK